MDRLLLVLKLTELRLLALFATSVYNRWPEAIAKLVAFVGVS